MKKMKNLRIILIIKVKVEIMYLNLEILTILLIVMNKKTIKIQDLIMIVSLIITKESLMKKS